MAARNINGNVTLTPNGLDSERIHSQFNTGANSPSSQHNIEDVKDFIRSMVPRPDSLLRSNSGEHPIVPAGLSTNTANRDANFLDFPTEIPSGHESIVYYYAVLKSLGPEKDQTAVVTTLAGCDVKCSTKGCQGSLRLRERELVTICCHKLEGGASIPTIVHAAAECTPKDTPAGSRVGSRAPTRPPTPAGS